MTKKELRAVIAAEVAALDSVYCEKADAAICAAVWESDLYKNARTMFCYIGTDREIDTKALLLRALADGKRLALPLCVGKGIMEAREIHSLNDLVSGKFGIPAPGEHCPIIEPEEFDLVNQGAYPDLQIQNFTITYTPRDEDGVGGGYCVVTYEIISKNDATKQRDVEMIVRLMND